MSNILCNLTEVTTDIKIMKVRENTQLPQKANETDACYDCYAAEMEETDTHVTYNLGFALEIPQGWCALIFPRSSVMKYGLSLANCVGIIDSGYRGEVKAVFTKLGFGNIYNVNDRVCQIMFYRLPSTQFVLVNSLDEENNRGGGFGSTGV